MTNTAGSDGSSVSHIAVNLKVEKAKLSLIKENRRQCSRNCHVSSSHFDGSANTLEIQLTRESNERATL